MQIVITPNIKKVFDIFPDNEIYLVGGSVRDFIMNRKTNDLDFCTNLKPDEISERIKSQGYHTYEVGKKYGTIGFTVDEMKVEITTYRFEKYNPGNRKPEVQFADELMDDLIRRDFSINAMAAERDGKVIDSFGGLDDIRNKRISVHGDIDKVFSDDPLRMLRAVRFISTLGFTTGFQTLKAIKEKAPSIMNISRERWKEEMDKLLMGDNVETALHVFITSRLTTYMLPELLSIVGLEQPLNFHHKNVFDHTRKVVKNCTGDSVLKWSGLLHDLGKAVTRTIENGEIHFYKHELVSELLAEGILERFKFSNEDKKRVLCLIGNHMRIVQYSPKWSNGAIRRLVKDSYGYLDGLIQLSKADITSSKPERVQRGIDNVKHLEDRIAKLEDEKTLVPALPKRIGSLVMEKLNIPQGKKVGETIKYLEQQILEGKIEPNQDLEYYTRCILEYEKEE